jgi:hypothetical protein
VWWIGVCGGEEGSNRGEGGFVFEGGVRLKRIFFTEMIRPMSYLVFNFASAWGNGSYRVGGWSTVLLLL